MKLDVCFLHLRCDPSAALSFPWDRSAGANHFFKSAVKSNPEDFFLNGFAHAPRELEVFKLQNQARIRRPPKNWLLVRIPGENPQTISLQKPLTGEIAADGEKAARIGIFGRGENQFFYQPIDRHGNNNADSKPIARLFHAGNRRLQTRIAEPMLRYSERLETSCLSALTTSPSM
jgi:hypothetical protein